MSAGEFALSLRDVTKRFGSTLALDGARIDVRPHTLHALLGENGAGKTTLMRLAFGVLRPDGGEVVVGGRPCRWRSSADAISAGLGMVHQHFLLVPAMTVAENVALAERGLLRTFDPRRAAERTRALAKETGLELDPAARVADLPVGAQQRLEIVKALARDANILILDEPTAVLSPSDARELYAWLRNFVARDRTVVLITHKIREALAVADDVTVLRRGRTTLAAAARDLDEARVVESMVGRVEVDAGARAAAPAGTSAGTSAATLSLEHVSFTDARGVPRLRDVSLEASSGEILGIAGVEGAGQHELLRVLAGRLTPDSGRVRIPREVGFVPEDRLRDALIPSMSLIENVALKEAGSLRGRVPWGAMTERTEATVRSHDVRGPGLRAAASSLSGGNQQKLVLGRELEGRGEAIVVENPTRGLDIRATAHVLADLRAARARGAAVVVYSSDLDEVLSLADRMVVCFDGRATAVAVEADVVARAMVGLT